MPEYKKKKVKRNIISNKKPKKMQVEKAQDIELEPIKNVKSRSRKKSELSVVKGNKLHRKRTFRIFSLSALCLALALVLLSVLLPVGIAENVNNLFAMAGKGGYPFELYGTQTLNNVSAGNYYYVLTDTNVNIRSNNGKEILTLSHGFTKPVLKLTSTRALVFDQGGNGLFVTNLREKVSERKIDSVILNANISRCGAYAVAYTADNYASVVSVYDKKDKLLYEWYSAEETVNNVAVSPNGKKLAVSTITASGGKLKSKLYVFTFDSANPDFTLDLGEKLVYTLDGGVRAGFAVVTESGFKYITWSKYKSIEYTTDLQMTSFKNTTGGMVAVSTLAGNKSDNKIAVFSTSGKKVSEFAFSGIISDISVSRNHIYCMSDTVVSIYSKEGELLRTAQCDFGAVRLSILSAYSVAIIRNDEVSRVEIKK